MIATKLSPRHKFVIRALCAAGLLLAVFFAVDIGAVATNFASLDPASVLCGLIAVQGQVVLSALRWRFTAERLGHRLNVTTAIGEYYLASLLNLVLPGGVAGDAARAARAVTANDAAPKRQSERGKNFPAPGTSSGAAIVRAVILERLAGQIAIFAVAAAGIAYWPWLLGDGPPGGTALLFAAPLSLAGLLAGVAILASKAAPRVIGERFAHLGPDIVRAWLAGGAWIAQGALSLAVAALYIAAFAFSSAAVGAPLPAGALVTIVPLALLTMLLPVSVGGFGLREGAAAALWPLAGLTAADGLAASLLYGVIGIAGALPGLAVLAGRRLSSPASRA